VGDITAPQLFIDRGVTFEGTCTMSGGMVRSLDEERDIALPTRPPEAEANEA
jgi:cytoskeletal protein CcmA (bactofilin family)